MKKRTAFGGPIAGSLLLTISAIAGGAAEELEGEMNFCRRKSSGRQLIVAAQSGDFKTIKQALEAARAGDKIIVRGGTHRGGIQIRKSGSESAGCITLQGEQGAVIEKGEYGIKIDNQSYIAIVGLKIRNITEGNPPDGILVNGSSNHIELRGNLIEDVKSSSNAHGISFLGDSKTPMSHILIEENEIRNCQLGSSESLTLNGNITKFVIRKNKIHDNNNIGIDLAGHWGVAPPGHDQVRNGLCAENEIYNIDTASNPKYHGDKNGGGIYVDGGRDIIVERNKVRRCNIGIEVGSEHKGKTASGVIIRNNQVSGSHHGNIVVGGADGTGGAASIIVEGNSLANAGGAEIIVQNNTNGLSIRKNVMRAASSKRCIQTHGGGNRNQNFEENTCLEGGREAGLAQGANFLQLNDSAGRENKGPPSVAKGRLKP